MIFDYQREVKEIKVRRGDIYYINGLYACGSEQMGNRPAVVVSNDNCNASSPVIEIVYLTAKLRKNHLPTHVEVNSEKRSIALCEQIHSVSKSRLGRYIGRITEQEESQINYALKISLELNGKK